jgi:hypothetical protein
MSDDLSRFLDLSVELTCFTRYELLGTGQADTYLKRAEKAAGPAFNKLLERFAALPQGAGRDTALRRDILGDEEIGPVARAITKLWYIGIWYEMPRAWTEKYGAREANKTEMVSPAAYAEGLLWTAIGAHPPGAKAQGYASWIGPPSIPPFPGARSEPQASAGPTVTQTVPGDVQPHHTPKPQHPPPPAEGNPS